MKEKPVVRRRIVKKQTKAIKRLSLNGIVHKVNGGAPAKFSQKTHENTLGFISKDGVEKRGKTV